MQSKGRGNGFFGQDKTLGRVIKTEQIQEIVGAGELAKGKKERWIPSERLFL